MTIDSRTDADYRVVLSLHDALVLRMATDPVPHGVVELERDDEILQSAALRLDQLRTIHMVLGLLIDLLAAAPPPASPPSPDNRPVAVVGGRIGHPEDLEAALSGGAP